MIRVTECFLIAGALAATGEGERSGRIRIVNQTLMAGSLMVLVSLS